MIEVNEYVRLARNQGINKIIDIYDKKYELETDIANEWGDLTCILEEHQLKDEIINHSKQLIDLIEVGDYVNGHRVVNEIWGEDDNNLYFEIEGGVNKVQYIGEEDIETILTKEQYQANCYKVEEKE